MGAFSNREASYVIRFVLRLFVLGHLVLRMLALMHMIYVLGQMEIFRFRFEELTGSAGLVPSFVWDWSSFSSSSFGAVLSSVGTRSVGFTVSVDRQEGTTEEI